MCNYYRYEYLISEGLEEEFNQNYSDKQSKCAKTATVEYKESNIL